MARWEEDNLPPLRLPSRNVGLGVGLLAISILLLVAILALGGKAGANVVNTNSVAFWCGSEDAGVKFDGPFNSSSFTVPGPGPWSLLVLKAGSDESVETGANETTVNPVVGQTYTHSSGKTLSHAILCYGVPPTTTTAPTTTGASTTGATTTAGTTTTATTLATTTTGATTTSPTTSSRGGDCEVNCTTTTAATTTVPQTTTTAGSCAPLCAGQFGTTTTTVAPTTTVASTTTTTAPTTTVAAHGPAALVTTAVDQTVPTTAPTQLPVTGGNPWWLILFGACMVALGLLLIAWTRPV